MVLISLPAPIACTDTFPVVPTVPVVNVKFSSLLPAIAPATIIFPPLLLPGLPMFVWIVKFAPSAVSYTHLTLPTT